jgi:hypothetical protein
MFNDLCTNILSSARSRFAPSAPLQPVAVLTLAVSLCACSYDVAAPVVPYPEVTSGYTTKVGGAWAIVVAKQTLNTHIEPSGFACGAFDYSVDVDSSFRRSLLQAFREIADNVVLVDHRLSANSLKAGGYSGQIEIEAPSLIPDITFTQNILSARVDANIELDATMTVMTEKGVLFEKPLAVSASSSADAGVLCQKAPQSMARAVGSALRQMVANSASAFSESRDVRLLSDMWQTSGMPHSP